MIQKLDAELKVTDGEDHDFYNQFNGLDGIEHLLIAYLEDTPAACGGFKPFDQTTAEVKRMYTIAEARGKGLAKSVLQELENWARSLGFKSLILETGIRQHAAIALYEAAGYRRIPNYGQYAGIAESFCFKKLL